MASPRKYSDPQRAAIWRLHEQGFSSAEIARLCAQGSASVAAFKPSARYIRELVQRMEAERRRSAPRGIDGIDREAIEHFPRRVERLLDRELTRMEHKRSLSSADLGRLDRAVTIRQRLTAKTLGTMGTGAAPVRPRTGRRSVLAELAADDSSGAAPERESGPAR